ncbi:TonB-dependent receptor [Brevundimonas sp.]|uniref:TonB-dependent receptor n=1 Tax=Brevundimonas sp. TaxID=1871086 RepID=UPI003919FB59
MRLNHLAYGASAVVIALAAASAASAQSTGTEAVEATRVDEVVITGVRGPRDIDGTIVAETVGKSRSTITQEFIATQAAGQTVLQSLNLVPGLNFTNNDPYGSSGGNIRLHGFDGNRISMTFDGIPLNDTGNYALYTNQQLDPELIQRATVNTGTTDADSPTASATGGTINYSSLMPTVDSGGWVQGSIGDHSYTRLMGLYQTGEFGPWGTRAWFAASTQEYDKFKGIGTLEKDQYNLRVYQPIRNNGDFVSVSAHYNRNRNNNYFGPTLTRNADGSLNVPQNAWFVDFVETYTPAPVRAGVADTDTNTGNYWGLRINPSDTGNIRGQSRFTLTERLILTVDPSYQYVMANGGTQQTVLSETSPLLRGTATTGGVDLNGDGDTLDSVRVMSPSNTNTHRYGLNTSLIWNFADNQSIRLAYALDHGRHRQTGEFGFIDFSDPTEPRFADVFGGRVDQDNRIVNLDGYYLRARDRRSIAELNQFSIEYNGDLLDRRLGLSVGVRAPFFERELNQFCFSQNASSNVRCTSETPNATLANGNVTFASTGTTQFIAPYSRSVEYDDILPNVNVTWRFDGNHSIYGSYAESMTLPRTDNLYTVARLADGSIQSSIAEPEETQTFDVGYRYTAGSLIASANVWYTSFQNRIVSTFDQDLGTFVDRNVGDVTMQGFDAQLGFSPFEGFSLYASASYTDSEIQDDLLYNTGVVLPTAGKTLVETPEWTYGWRGSYENGPLQFGLQGKYVSERWLTDLNDLESPSYTVWDVDGRIDLGYFGFEGTFVQVNIMNLFDENYFGSLGTTITADPAYTGRGFSNPFVNIGSPRTGMVSLRVAF